MVRCDLGGDGQAPLLRVAEELDGRGGRDVEDVQGCPGQRDEQAVAGDDRRFGDRGPAGDPEAARPLPLVHVPATAEARVLGVLADDGPRQRLGVLEGPAHHPGRLDAGPVVGEEAHAERVELPHRGERGAGPALRDAAGGVHVAHRLRAGAEDGRDDGRVVEGRLGVGHGDERGVAAERGGARARLDRLGFLVAGLAQVRVQVDEAGRDDAAVRVEDAVGVESRPDGGHDAVLDTDVGGPLTGRVDDATAAHEQ